MHDTKDIRSAGVSRSNNRQSKISESNLLTERDLIDHRRSIWIIERPSSSVANRSICKEKEPTLTFVWVERLKRDEAMCVLHPSESITCVISTYSSCFSLPLRLTSKTLKMSVLLCFLGLVFEEISIKQEEKRASEMLYSAPFPLILCLWVTDERKIDAIRHIRKQNHIRSSKSISEDRSVSVCVCVWKAVSLQRWKKIDPERGVRVGLGEENLRCSRYTPTREERRTTMTTAKFFGETLEKRWFIDSITTANGEWRKKATRMLERRRRKKKNERERKNERRKKRKRTHDAVGQST